jgi:hypothetical protein
MESMTRFDHGERNRDQQLQTKSLLECSEPRMISQKKESFSVHRSSSLLSAKSKLAR